MSAVKQTLLAARALSQDAGRLQFAAPVTHVYNPLDYAWQAYAQYVSRMNPRGARVLFLGMNPGPWGMAQTGVPFGQVAAVGQWLAIDAPIGRPEVEHPRRPVEGLACRRNEVSGQRLWGLFQDRFETPERFFAEHFVANYCPLVFMETTGRNRTPDKLAAEERLQLTTACDQHLRRLLEAIRPQWAVGVGAYAADCLRRVIGTAAAPRVVRVLHPSPASPLANRGWAEAATQQLVAAGVWRENVS